MIRALAASFAQLTDAAILGVVAKSLAITLLILAAVGGTAVLFADDAMAWLGWQQGGLAAQLVIALAAMAAAWLLFRAVAVPVMSLFADEIVAAVEARHYPDAARDARPVGFGTNARLALGSFGRLILFNLIALPGYIVLAVTGVGAVLLFGLVNALLLGRDLGEMVAVRHFDSGARAGWLRATRLDRLILGAIATGLFLIPLINLIAPVIGAAMATHLFHRSRQKGTRA